MTQKQTKIHSLGPRKMSSTAKNFFNNTAPNNFYNKPIVPVIPVQQPQIRYLLVQHPQFDILVKQLTCLRKKYDELLVKFEQKSTQQTLRANIQQVIESTHNIEARMSRIVQDANKMSSSSDEKQNQPSLQSQRVRHQKQCLQIIQTVNRATQKIEQLEQRNSKLSKQIQTQKEWKQGLDKENKRLRLMLQNMERQKEQEIQRLENELKEIKKKKQEQKSQNVKIQPEQVSKKINNSQYLVEDDKQMGVELSGFSRLTINGQASRLSRIYE